MGRPAPWALWSVYIVEGSAVVMVRGGISDLQIWEDRSFEERMEIE